HVDHRLEAERERGEGGGQQMDVGEVVGLDDRVSPQSPTRTTNWWNVRPAGVSHWRNTLRMRDWAASYSDGPPPGRSSHLSTYFRYSGLSVAGVLMRASSDVIAGELPRGHLCACRVLPASGGSPL